jgi:hypothetical protein
LPAAPVRLDTHTQHVELAMADEKAEALRVFRRQVGTFHTPPGCDDGVLARSFACNPDYIYEFALRNVDKVVTLTAFRHPGPPEDENVFAANSRKAVPKVGRRVGQIYRGPIEQLPLPGPDPNEA